MCYETNNLAPVVLFHSMRITPREHLLMCIECGYAVLDLVRLNVVEELHHCYSCSADTTQILKNLNSSMHMITFVSFLV